MNQLPNLKSDADCVQYEDYERGKRKCNQRDEIINSARSVGTVAHIFLMKKLIVAAISQLPHLTTIITISLFFGDGNDSVLFFQYVSVYNFELLHLHFVFIRQERAFVYDTTTSLVCWDISI